MFVSSPNLGTSALDPLDLSLLSMCPSPIPIVQIKFAALTYLPAGSLSAHSRLMFKLHSVDMLKSHVNAHL